MVGQDQQNISAQGGGNIVAFFDEARLTPRYWVSLGLLSLVSALDYFDFYIVGFLVAVLGPRWHLTYGQSAVMLLSAGLGSIVGALMWGSFADAWGRKRLIVAATLICGGSAAAVGLIPDGSWIVFALLRFGVGFGMAGTSAASIALVVEYTPTRFRTTFSSLTVVFASSGSLLAAATAALLLSSLGWRGVAALGIAPAVVGVLVGLIVPESVRWLVAKGHFTRARETLARLLGLPLSAVPMPVAGTAPQSPVRAVSGFGSLYAHPRRFWFTVVSWMGAATSVYGAYLWGPTIVALLLKVGVSKAAHYFVFVSLAGMVGKTIFSFLPQWLGRRRCGQLHGFGAAVALVAAGYAYTVTIDGFPVFVLLLIVGALFFEGGYANLTPYTVEIFSVRSGARASGLGQAANGVGKILGPLCLALIAGTGNMLTPQATEAAVFPAFLFLASAGLAVGLASTFLTVETHGQPLALDDQDPMTTRQLPTGLVDARST